MTPVWKQAFVKRLTNGLEDRLPSHRVFWTADRIHRTAVRP
ncbi:hypothetical protein [Streptomyces sp. NBC_00147]